MAYLGNRNATGENNSFKILDDLSFTSTFNGSDGNVVNHVADTITINNHRFLTGSRVTYSNGGGGNITGLTNGTVYFTIKVDHNTIKLATTAVEDPSKVEVKARSSKILKLLFSPVALRLPRYAMLHHH